MTTETIYLTISPSKKYWRHPRISRVSKKKPTIPVGHALVELRLNLPDNCLKPPRVIVNILPEHIATADVTVEATKAP